MAITDAVGTVLSGGLSAAGSLASGIMSAVQGKKDRESYENQQHLNRVFENEQASKAYERQVDFWKMQNAYNSPAQQMARLRAAGLNPDLAISGNVQNSVGGLSSVSKGSAPSASYAPPTDYSAFATAAQTAAQTVKTVQDARKAKAETNLTEQETLSKEIENQWSNKLYEQKFQIGGLEYQAKGLNLLKSKQDIELGKEELLNLAQARENMKVNADLWRAQIAGQNLANVAQQLEIMFNAQTFEDRCREVQERVNSYAGAAVLSFEQAKDLVATRALRVANLDSDLTVKRSHANLNNSQMWLNDTLRRGRDLENKLVEEYQIPLADDELEVRRYEDNEARSVGFKDRNHQEAVTRSTARMGSIFTLGISGAVSAFFGR